MSSIFHHGLPAFEYYFQPKTVEEAVSLLSHDQDIRVLAGGTDLLVLMRARAIKPKGLIDINGITGLSYIRYDGGQLRIGALTTLRDIEQSSLVSSDFFFLKEAVLGMANAQIKSIATVIGNLCRASPAADTAAPLLALNAAITIAGPSGSRTEALDHFFLGPGTTILKPDELAVEVQVPQLPPSCGTAFLRVGRVACDLAKANVAVALVAEQGHCQEVRIALGGVAPIPIRAHRAEAAFKGKTVDEGLIKQAAEIAVGETMPITDIRSTEEYRRELSMTLVRQAISLSLERSAQGRES